MFTLIIFLRVLCPFVGFLWARITSLWMSKSMKRAAWRFPPSTDPRATAPLSHLNKALPALAAHDDIKRRTASQTPPSPPAAQAAYRSSAPSRSDAWRGRLCLTGTSRAAARPEPKPLPAFERSGRGVAAPAGRPPGYRWQSNSHPKMATSTGTSCTRFAPGLIRDNRIGSPHPFLPSRVPHPQTTVYYLQRIAPRDPGLQHRILRAVDKHVPRKI